ncbi:MAG: methionine biosynthesis protein MetW [Myxococcota bacterium]
MTADARRYGELVERHGLSLSHRTCLAWVPPESRVLELGCSTGFIGAALIRDKGCTVDGIEVDPAAADIARERGLDVTVGSLESAALLDRVGRDYDIVLATDVLEHLRAPEEILARVPQWLSSAGRFIAAVPNVAVWSMRMRLFRGDFTYEETGLLDRTHLRFYTWHTFQALLEEFGYSVEERVVDTWEIPGLQTAWDGAHARLARLDRDLGRSRVDRAVNRFVRRRLRVFVEGHQRWGARLGRVAPNLAATHMTVRLQPPATTSAPSSR